MSHEIRTPLNCIIGMLSLLLKSSEDEENSLTPMQQESMRLVVSSGELLAAVVNDVLDYSKLESGNVDFNLETRSLQDTMDTVTRSLTVKAAAKNIQLKTVYDPRIPENIKTDHLRLQQILFNLLGNAVKFSKDDGTIDLHVSIVGGREQDAGQGDFFSEGSGHRYYYVPDDAESADSGDKRITAKASSSDYMADSTRSLTSRSARSLSIRSEGSFHSRVSSNKNDNKNRQRLRFTVKDYGKGLEPQQFENVFRPFFQTEEETKKVHGGTGLGLA